MKRYKKNHLLRAAAIALIFTLVSTCLMSGTLAKYIASASGSDTARVAKWGVVISSVDTLGLFRPDYEAESDNQRSLGDSISVKAKLNTDGSTRDNVVAPGTSGSAGSMKITGTPEVACKITIEVDEENSTATGWSVFPLNGGYVGGGSAPKYDTTKSVDYLPVIFTWKLPGPNQDDEPVSGTFEELKTALAGFELYVPIGEDLSTYFSASGANLEISWAWAFEELSAPVLDRSSDTFADTYRANLAALVAEGLTIDEADTCLADRAAGDNGVVPWLDTTKATPAALTLSYTITVEQVD